MPNTKFILNTPERNLATVLSNLLPSKTKAMDFLVGYFYFTGIQQIYQNIEDKPMRILVGMDIDKDLMRNTSIAHQLYKQTSSREEQRQAFYQQLVALFNETEYFENEAQAEAFKVYYNKLKEGSLIIKKTKEPCHAKLYIFDYKDELTEGGETPGEVITGSSNLTYSGMQGNSEINVRLHDQPDHEAAKKIFEDLWETAILIADKDTIGEFEKNVVEHIWFEKLPTPYLLYLRVLYEYFHIDTKKRIFTPNDITGGEFQDFRYQEDAVRLALDAIKTHHGVIVADVVGLGKSIIASTVAHNINLRTIIICPPHLVKQWEDYRVDFRVEASVFSRGNMEAVHEFYLSHKRRDEEWLVIVDEGHAYRNEFIHDYAILHEICKGNRVMLLTATPFNNHPQDIYTMIRLFQNPTKSTLKTVNNLGAEFTSLITTYKKIKRDQKENRMSKQEVKTAINSVASEIRRIIGPIVIRRSRIDLQKIPAYKKDLKSQGIEFPDVNPPQLQEYRLGDLEELYRKTLSRISPKQTDFDYDDEDVDIDAIRQRETEQQEMPTFQAARYKPVLYVKNECINDVKKVIEDAGLEYNLFVGGQGNLADFMRKLLVHRFESSQYAFRISLQNMLENCQRMKAWIEKRNTVPVMRRGSLPNVQDFYESNDDTMDYLLEQTAEEAIHNMQSKGMFEIKTEYLDERFFEDLDSDITLLEELKTWWDKVPQDVEHDPKLESFIDLLKTNLQGDPQRKIVVFSQFADTVDYLGKQLVEAGLPVFFYTSKKATVKNKEIIKANFDAGYPEHKQVDEFKILVATDAISEGYNLHRAGTIYNYDIPYNPTRIIQRVGRINRINKKMFDQLFIYNYFPTNIGEADTHTKEITTLKMDMIHALMGEDTQYLTSDEELNNYFAKQYKELIADDEVESWDVPYRTLLEEMENSPEMKKALELPKRSKIRRITTNPDIPTSILAFARLGSDYVFKSIDSEGHVNDLTPETALNALQADKEEQPVALTQDFASRFDLLKHHLFTMETEAVVETTKRKAIDKIRLLIQLRACDMDYLEDLATAIERDALAGYSLREINRLKQADFSKLPTIVSPEYVKSALSAYDNVQTGEEVLIIAEQFQNIITHPQTEIELQ